MGDLLYDRSNHQSAISHYLSALATYYGVFAKAVRGNNDQARRGPWHLISSLVVRRLITCFSSLKCSTTAAVLCQYLTPVDFTLAFKLLQEEPIAANSTHLQYVWEMPLLELLIHIYTTAKDDEKTDLLMRIVERPELNQANFSSIQKQVVNRLRCGFLRVLVSEYNIE